MVPPYLLTEMLSIRQNENQKIYWMTDPHLGHQRDFIWKPRGYESYEEHTDDIINVTNQIVRPTDILCILGDFCLNTTLPQFESYLSRFQCQNIWMLWGNHNNPHQKSIYRPLVEKILKPLRLVGHYTLYPVQYRNVKYIGDYYEISVDGQMICMFHYPIFSWNEMANGAWMLHGHMHCNGSPTHGKILDVGWEGQHKPWSFEEIKAIMDIRPIVGDGGHHGKNIPLS